MSGLSTFGFSRGPDQGVGPKASLFLRETQEWSWRAVVVDRGLGVTRLRETSSWSEFGWLGIDGIVQGCEAQNTDILISVVSSGPAP
jgi:hypothetical protein